MSDTELQSQRRGIPTPEELGFDPVTLRQKYTTERTTDRCINR